MTIQAGTFAEACYDMNTREELEDALRVNNSETDCKTWGITHEQWRENIQVALDEMDEDAEADEEAETDEHGVPYMVEALAKALNGFTEADWRDLGDGEEPQCSCEIL